MREIDTQIQLANENPAKQIEVLLQPGAQAGQVEASIAVTEQPASRFSIGLDNTGNAATGRWRANLGYQHAALFGRDHVLALQLQVAPEEDRCGHRRQRQLPHSAVRAGDGDSMPTRPIRTSTAAPARPQPVPLQFSGRGRIYGLRASKYLPRFGEFDHRMIVGLDNRDYINSCSIAGLPPGACGNRRRERLGAAAGDRVCAAQGGREPLRCVDRRCSTTCSSAAATSDDAQFRKLRPGSEPRYTTLRFGLFGALRGGRRHGSCKAG